VKLSALHRALIVLVLLIVVVIAQTVLAANGIDAARLEGMRDILILVLLDCVGATALSKSGRTSLWSKPRSDAPEPRRPIPPAVPPPLPGAALPPLPPHRRDDTPIPERVRTLIAERRYTEAHVIAVQYGLADLLLEIDAARDNERVVASRPEDTRSGRRRR
jgi:hypothetical protein